MEAYRSESEEFSSDSDTDFLDQYDQISVDDIRSYEMKLAEVPLNKRQFAMFARIGYINDDQTRKWGNQPNKFSLLTSKKFSHFSELLDDNLHEHCPGWLDRILSLEDTRLSFLPTLNVLKIKHLGIFNMNSETEEFNFLQEEMGYEPADLEETVRDIRNKTYYSQGLIAMPVISDFESICYYQGKPVKLFRVSKSLEKYGFTHFLMTRTTNELLLKTFGTEEYLNQAIACELMYNYRERQCNAYNYMIRELGTYFPFHEQIIIDKRFHMSNWFKKYNEKMGRVMWPRKGIEGVFYRKPREELIVSKLYIYAVLKKFKKFTFYRCKKAHSEDKNSIYKFWGVEFCFCEIWGIIPDGLKQFVFNIIQSGKKDHSKYKNRQYLDLQYDCYGLSLLEEVCINPEEDRGTVPVVTQYTARFMDIIFELFKDYVIRHDAYSRMEFFKISQVLSDLETGLEIEDIYLPVEIKRKIMKGVGGFVHYNGSRFTTSMDMIKWHHPSGFEEIMLTKGSVDLYFRTNPKKSYLLKWFLETANLRALGTMRVTQIRKSNV
jgi:hypothetical protein